MASKGQSITVTYYAWNTSTNGYQTGDAANHTLRLLKDGTEAAPTNSNAELDSTNTPGLYTVALTSAECTFNTVDIAGKSSTANVVLIGKTYTFENLPQPPLGTQGGLLAMGSGVGQLNTTSGFALSNVQQWLGIPPNAVQNGLVQAAVLSGLVNANLTLWEGTAPNALQNGLVQVATLSGAATSVLGSVASVTSGVNITQAGGIAVTANSGFLQVNVTQISGIAPQITLGGFIEADVELWRGSQPATLTSTFVQVDVEDWKTAAVNSLISGRVDVNVGQVQTAAITSAAIDTTFITNVADGLGNRVNAIETGLTPYQSWRLAAAALGGQLSGAGTAAVGIWGAGVTTTRIAATTSQSGNRQSVTLTL